MSTKKDEIEKVDSPVALTPYNRNTMSFSDMANEADEVLGNELLKDEVLVQLDGVPFAIYRITFRPSFRSRKDKDVWLAYVSCEAVIADEEWLTKSGKTHKLKDKPFRPGEHIVFNDGSTGVYRQIVAYLETKGFIKLPEGPEGGAKEESRFDVPPSGWADILAGESHFPIGGPEGFQEYTADIRLLCPRGTRTSEYSNDYAENAETRYLA